MWWGDNTVMYNLNHCWMSTSFCDQNFKWNIPFRQVSHSLCFQTPSQSVSGECLESGPQDNTQTHILAERTLQTVARKESGPVFQLFEANIEEEIYPALALPICNQQLLSCKHTRNLDLSSWPNTGWGGMQQKHFQTILLMYLLVQLFPCQVLAYTPTGGASSTKGSGKVSVVQCISTRQKAKP